MSRQGPESCSLIKGHQMTSVVFLKSHFLQGKSLGGLATLASLMASLFMAFYG